MVGVKSQNHTPFLEFQDFCFFQLEEM